MDTQTRKPSHDNQACSPQSVSNTIVSNENAQRCEILPRKNARGPGKDDRVTIKIDRDMWRVISRQVRDHPEWGVKSVSDFIRRAIAHELEAKTSITERKVLEIQLRPTFSREDSRGRDPGRLLG